MAATTKEMNQLCSDYMRWCAERNAEMIAKYAIEDDEAGYIGIHTTPGPWDMNLQEAIDRIGPLAKAQSLNINSQGWYIGDVAWFVTLFNAVLPDGVPAPDIRGTVVMRRVDDEWKIAHWHVSEAVDRSAHFPKK